MTPEEVERLEAWKEETLKRRIEHLEGYFDDFDVIEGSYAEENDLPKLSKVKSMIQDVEDEINVARQGWDAWSQYTENWLKDRANMDLPKVELEKLCPARGKPPVKVPAEFCNAILPWRENQEESLMLQIPLVQKLRLTEASEQEIFGELSPYRNASLPPIFMEDKFYIKKLAVIDEEQVKIYNDRQVSKNTNNTKNMIHPGVVEVFRDHWDVKLENVDEGKDIEKVDQTVE